MRRAHDRSVHVAECPADRLHLHVLTEPDGGSTRKKLHRLVDRSDFSLYRIPEADPGEPNKPRALNNGFSLTDGGIDAVRELRVQSRAAETSATR